MNRMLRIGVAIFVLLFIVHSVSADQWDQYIEFMSRFYYLDTQSFDTISCQVVAVSLDTSLAQLREQLKPLEGQIEIRENIADFTLYFNKKAGLDFKRPSFEIRILSEETLENPQQVKTGIEYVKTGVQHQIDGTIQMLTGLFAYYLSPQHTQITINHLSRQNDQVKLVYTRDNMMVTEMYSGKQCHSEQRMENVQSQADLSFIEVGNKLIIGQANMHLQQVGSTIDADMTIEYQTLQAIIFPARIVQNSTLVTQKMQQTGEVEVLLKNCQMN